MKVYYISINYSVEDELGSSKFWVQQNIFIVSWCTGLVLRLSSTDLSQSFLCKYFQYTCTYAFVTCLCLIKHIIDQVYYPCHCALSLFFFKWTTRVHLYYGKFFVCFCIHQSVRYMFFCKKEDVLNINVHGLPL